MKTKSALFCVCILLITTVAFANTYYVDSSASGANDGTSWTDAWTSLTDVTGVSGDDMVYISGGSSSETYDVSSWTPIGGTSGHPVTYQVGQDAGHNGIVILNGGGAGFAMAMSANVILNGNAGNKSQHIEMKNCPYGIKGKDNIRLAYIAFGEVEEIMHIAGSFYGIEIDHCTATAIDDHLAYWDVNGSAYGLNSVHDNVFGLCYSNAGAGADGFQASCACTDFYNNYIYGIHDGRGVNHPDAWQASGGQSGSNYIRIYDNKIRDLANYGIYFSLYAGTHTASHVRIYNNEFEVTDSSFPTGTAQSYADIVMSSDPRYIWNDVLVANNTMSDTTSSLSPIYFASGSYDSITNCRVDNNVSVNGNSNVTSLASPVSRANNIRLTSGDSFVSYTQYGKSNDMHLVSSATSLIGKGTCLSSYFTTDKDGVSRPQSSAWDIGAYEFSGQTALQPPSAPSVRIMQ